jgi:DNA polymerase IV
MQHGQKKSTEAKRIFCIDMNSYFASVEQQYNPKLRGRPIAVMGEGKGSFVIAASKEAKIYGVKTGMRLFEALEACPQLVRVKGDGEKYVYTRDKIEEILNRYFYCIEGASIDEFYLDAKGEEDWNRLRMIALQIKKDIKEEIGECITSSIGISTNKLMAKLASNMKKPDGLIVLTPEDIARVIPNTRVEAISGIGGRLQKRLNALGIYTFKSFTSFPKEVLLKEFGPHATRFFLNASQGIYEDTFKTEEPYLEILYNLVVKAVHRMKKKKMKTRQAFVYIRYKEMPHESSHVLFDYTDNAFEIYRHVQALFHSIYNPEIDIKQVGIRLGKTLSSENLPVPLFTEKKDLLNDAMYEINRKYGQFTIIPLGIYNTRTLHRKTHGFYKAIV